MLGDCRFLVMDRTHRQSIDIEWKASCVASRVLPLQAVEDRTDQPCLRHDGDISPQSTTDRERGFDGRHVRCDPGT